MHLWVWFLYITIVVGPPIAYLLHTRWLQQRHGATEQGLRLALYRMAMLLGWIVGSSLIANRLIANSPALIVLFFLPVTAQGLLLWPAYRHSRYVHGDGWTWGAFRRTHEARGILLVVVGSLPIVILTAVIGLIAWARGEAWLNAHSLVVLIALLAGALLSVPVGMWVWRRTGPALEPIPAANPTANAPAPGELILPELRAMAAHLGLAQLQVYRWDVGSGATAMVWLQGAGTPTPRLLVPPQVLERFPPAEIALLMAQSLGHYRLGHRYWRTIFVVLSTLIIMAPLPLWVLALHGLGWSVTRLRMYLACLPMLLLAAVIIRFASAMRHRMERAADDWATRATGRPDLLSAALERWHDQLQAEFARLPRLFRWHGLLRQAQERIARLRDLATPIQ